jgi:hypothetical protein
LVKLKGLHSGEPKVRCLAKEKGRLTDLRLDQRMGLQLVLPTVQRSEKTRDRNSALQKGYRLERKTALWSGI